jgi:hypothetical protein
MPEPIVTVDFGQLTVAETFIKPITRLSFEVRIRTACAGCRAHLLQQANDDVAGLGVVDQPDDWAELAAFVMTEWEGRAEQVGLLGYASEGFYYIEAQP